MNPDVVVNKKAPKKKWRIGVILHICTVAVYLYLLWGTNIIRNMWSSGGIIQAHFPLAIFSLALCVISVFFLRKSDYYSGFWINFGMIFVQAITSCVWAGGVGILAWRLVVYLIRNSLTVIIPCAVSTVEGDEEKRREEKEKKEAREKAERELREKEEEEEREKAEILRKQQEKKEEERKKAEEEKWQEDIRTGKVDLNKAEVFFDKGIMLLDSEKYHEAIEQFTKAIEFNPRYSEAYCNRGIAFYTNGEIDKAIDDYYKARSFNNNDKNGRKIQYNLGRAYMEKKSFNEAYYSFYGLIHSLDFTPGSIQS